MPCNAQVEKSLLRDTAALHPKPSNNRGFVGFVRSTYRKLDESHAWLAITEAIKLYRY